MDRGPEVLECGRKARQTEGLGAGVYSVAKVRVVWKKDKRKGR
jgi:hypothetical protein